MKLDDIRHGVGALWESVTDGWERLRQTAAGALTRYRPGDPADLPTRDEIDDASYVPSASWALLGGDVFEDDKRVPLPAPVKSDKSRASYRTGVLRVELPKQSPGQPSVKEIRVS